MLLFDENLWVSLRMDDALDFDCFSSKKLIDQRVSWRFNASLLGRSSKPQ